MPKIYDVRVEASIKLLRAHIRWGVDICKRLESLDDQWAAEALWEALIGEQHLLADLELYRGRRPRRGAGSPFTPRTAAHSRCAE